MIRAFHKTAHFENALQHAVDDQNVCMQRGQADVQRFSMLRVGIRAEICLFKLMYRAFLLRGSISAPPAPCF